MMCSTNISEGGYLSLGRRNSILTTYTGLNMLVAGTFYVVLALKVNSLYEQGAIKPININISYNGAATSNTCTYQLQLHSTYGSVGSISGPALSYSTISDSIGQFAIGTTAETLASDGYILSAGSVNSHVGTNLSANDFELLLPRAICTRNGTYFDTLYIFATATTNTSDVYASLDFMELN